MDDNSQILNEQTAEFAQEISGELLSKLIFIGLNATLWGLLALIAAIIILVILKKKALFHRDHKVWNILAKLHYPVWIVIFCITGCTHGALNSVSSNVEDILEQAGKPYLDANIPVLYEYLMQELPEMAPNETITIQLASEHIIQKLQLPEDNWVVNKISELFMVYCINMLVTNSLNQSGNIVHMNDLDFEFSPSSLKPRDLNRSNQSISDVIFEALIKQINKVFKSIQLNNLIIAIFILFILLLEPLMHYYWKKKQPNHSDW